MIGYPDCARPASCKDMNIPICPVLAQEVEKLDQLQSESMVGPLSILQEDLIAFCEEGEVVFRSRRHNAREMYDLMNETGSKNAAIIHLFRLTEQSLYRKLAVKTVYKAEKDSRVSEMILKLLKCKEDDPEFYVKIFWKINEDGSAYPAVVVWVTRWQHQQARKYFGISEYNDTFDTNDAGYKLGLLIVVDKFMRTVVVGQCLQTNLTTESFKFVWGAV
jgi:predicted CopG family antitoxin